ncbi:MAG: hypothetical protein AAF745_10335, partial [Planctomycetota bacterium]
EMLQQSRALEFAGERRSLVQPVATTRQINGTRASSGDSQWQATGIIDGNVVVAGDLGAMQMRLDIEGDDLRLSERSTDARGRQSTRSVWHEARLTAQGRINADWRSNQFQMDGVDIASDWFATTLRGSVNQEGAIQSVDLSGPASFDMAIVGDRLSQLAGLSIIATGNHQTPIALRYANGNGQSAFTVGGSLGWEQADAAGMLFGPTEVPFTMTESMVVIDRCHIPVLGVSRQQARQIGPQVAPLSYDPSAASQWRNQSDAPADFGELTLAGRVEYRPELIVTLEPGPVANQLRLTPEMTENWLKYIAPIAADAARLEGVVGIDLDEAHVVVDRPNQTRVRGRLNVGQVRMNAGPLADQMISRAKQIKALASGGRATAMRTGRTLIDLPAQMVEFQVADGFVSHRALMMDIDRARVVTSGNVGLDGRLDLVAQVPLDSNWIGSDLRGLAGQQLTLPIDGTLSRPSIDSSGVQRVLTDFATRAAQEAGGRFLQNQLDRGQQQLEEGLQKGLNKLFGR